MIYHIVIYSHIKRKVSQKMKFKELNIFYLITGIKNNE